MKCHYEVLGLAREATAAEIKTAYRRLALQWHPDKNPDNLQEAKEQFQVVQNAYEVLSDAQERAWYDNHREQLLRGAGSSYNDSSLDVFPYFSTSCYKGFADDPQGFYAVYAEIFSKLAAEETDFLEDPEDVGKIPTFGTSTSPYEEVHEFYAFWMSFSTNKSFVWLDQYDIQQGDNRRVIKLMEKENNKIRQKARKERNEEVRRLASFVRRRDRRVLQHTRLLQERAEENKKKAEQLRRERIIQRQKEIEEAQKNQGESSFLGAEDYQKKLSEIENLLQEEFGISSDDDTISEGGMESSNEDSSKTEEVSEASKAAGKPRGRASAVRNLYCTACGKLFRNVNSFENHENSRKHRENVASMTLDADVAVSDGGTSSPEAGVNAREEQGGGEQGVAERGEGDADGGDGSTSERGDAKETLSDASAHLEVPTRSQKKKKSKRRALAAAESEGNDSHDEMSYTEGEPARSRRARRPHPLKSHAQAKKEATNKEYLSHTSTENIDEPPPPSPPPAAPPASPPTGVQDPRPPTPNEKAAAKTPRTNKPKKPEKKPAKAKEGDEVTPETNLHCAVCRSQFQSKNKLFDHLKKTGHSVPLAQGAPLQKKGKRGNR